MNTSADNHDDGSELQTVMGAYFDALLHDAALKPVDNTLSDAPVTSAGLNQPVSTAATAAQPVIAPDPVNAAVDAAITVAPLKPVAVTIEPPAPPVEEVMPAVTESAVAFAGNVPDPDSEPQSSGVPAYQLIRIGGVTLGIANDAIDEITALPTAAAPAKGDPAWVLGSYETAQGESTIIDTAAVLIPGNAGRVAAGGSHIVQLKGQPWALACDAIGDVLRPDPGQVTWRGAEGKRLWLAGTIRTPSCALLDIGELIKLLAM